jgi:hypothetical protein
MNGYELTRKWFDFSFEKKEANVYHTSIFVWCIELNNRLGWKKEFGLPTQATMEGLSIGNKNTYLSALKELQIWGFIQVIKESKNQYQSCIISICHYENDTTLYTALDTALIQHDTRHEYDTIHAIDTIDKQLNNKTINKETKKQPANRRANLFSDLFTTWFKDKFELSYSMKTKDFVGIATIEKYCKENAKGEPIEMFRFILENYDSLQEFYQTNINPSFIASRISEIASMLKKQHTKTQTVKQVENEPVNRKWFPSPSQYYSECISKKQDPFNFWTGNEMTEDEKISEYKIHKVGEYRYA